VSTITARDAIADVITSVTSPVGARAILGSLPSSDAYEPVGDLDLVTVAGLIAHVMANLKVFSVKGEIQQVSWRLWRNMSGGVSPKPCRVSIHVASDRDLVRAQRATALLTAHTFSPTEAVQMGTAVSELGRNIYLYAKSGDLHLSVGALDRVARFELEAVDQGPGIPNLEGILAGKYVSKTGLGRGILGTKALLDDMVIDSKPGVGTTIRGWKNGKQLWR
jgi:serine/threonine-protein kinase RsbT